MRPCRFGSRACGDGRRALAYKFWAITSVAISLAVVEVELECVDSAQLVRFVSESVVCDLG